MPLENNSWKPQRSIAEYQAARATDRFFCEITSKAAGLKELADAKCFNAVVDSVVLIEQVIAAEIARREQARHKQLELEGLLTASDRAAVNQREMFSL